MYCHASGGALRENARRLQAQKLRPTLRSCFLRARAHRGWLLEADEVDFQGPEGHRGARRRRALRGLFRGFSKEGLSYRGRHLDLL